MNAMNVDDAEDLMDKLMAADASHANFSAASELLDQRVTAAREVMKQKGKMPEVDADSFLNSQNSIKNTTTSMQEAAKKATRQVMFEVKISAKANKDADT